MKLPIYRTNENRNELTLYKLNHQRILDGKYQLNQ